MKKDKRSNQQGFTLIELVFVIVILGILAAAALPRFVDLTTDARKSSMEALSGSVRSAIAMTHGQAIVKKQTGSTGTITVEGKSITLVNGYPAAAAVSDLLSDLSGFTESTGTTSTVFKNGAATPASCQLSYTEAVGSNVAPVVVLTVSDCS